MQDDLVFTHISKQLLQARELAGLSLEEAATALGYDAELWQKMESGAPIDVAMLYRLCQLFQCDPAYFFHGLPGFEPESSEVDELMRNFLLIDHPNRGQLFEDFVSEIDRQNNES